MLGIFAMMSRASSRAYTQYLNRQCCCHEAPKQEGKLNTQYITDRSCAMWEPVFLRHGFGKNHTSNTNCFHFTCDQAYQNMVWIHFAARTSPFSQISSIHHSKHQLAQIPTKHWLWKFLLSSHVNPSAQWLILLHALLVLLTKFGVLATKTRLRPPQLNQAIFPRAAEVYIKTSTYVYNT